MYGQKNYLEIQGRVNPANGLKPKYRIDQIGCFITAFSNLLKRDFGQNINPAQINALLRDRGAYIDVDDGITDDVGWQTVTAVNPYCVVKQTGTGRPPLGKCIAKFKYQGSAGFTTHFCLVDHIDAAGNVWVVDSYDGVVKNGTAKWGSPLAWASYGNNTPQPVQPPAPKPAPVSIGAPNYDGDYITVQPGWGISHALKAAGFPEAEYKNPAQWDRVAQRNGFVKAIDFKLVSGARIRVGKYTAPAAPIAPKPEPAPVDTDIVTVFVKEGWGISHVLKAVGYPQAEYSNPVQWDETARLNGHANASTFKLVPNQAVNVRRYKAPVVEPPAPVPAPAPVQEATEQPQPAEPAPEPPKSWKDSYEDFKDAQSGKRVIIDYVAEETLDVYDLETGAKITPQLKIGQTVHGAGEFRKDDDLYVRTVTARNNDSWTGVSILALRRKNQQVTPVEDEDDDSLFELDTAAELKELAGYNNLKEKIVAILGKLSILLSKFKRKK